MTHMLRRIEPDQAMLGMYIRKFEGSWLFHPFWRARFVVRSEEQLARVRNGGVAVFIDPARGTDLPAPARTSDGSRRTPRAVATEPFRHAPPPPRRQASKVTAPLAFGKADKVRAAALAQRSAIVVKALFENCHAAGSLSMAPILSVVEDIADTLEQNSAALISVTRLRAKDDAIYTHSIAVCALMIGLAREAGYSAAAVRTMGIAGLLHDVGKLAVKGDLPADAGTAELRRHPQAGHEILAAEAGLSPVVLDVCLHHHERLDGSGYPFGMQGIAVTQASRMAAICDVYDTMTSTGALSPAAAIDALDADGARFDSALAFKFMRSIGVFPAGKLVRLRSNRLAVILPATGENRRPVARAFYSTIETRFVPYQDVVIGDNLASDQAMSEERPEHWFSDDWAAMRKEILEGASTTSKRRFAA